MDSREGYDIERFRIGDKHYLSLSYYYDGSQLEKFTYEKVVFF